MKLKLHYLYALVNLLIFYIKRHRKIIKITWNSLINNVVATPRCKHQTSPSRFRKLKITQIQGYLRGLINQSTGSMNEHRLSHPVYVFLAHRGVPFDRSATSTRYSPFERVIFHPGDVGILQITIRGGINGPQNPPQPRRLLFTPLRIFIA